MMHSLHSSTVSEDPQECTLSAEDKQTIIAYLIENPRCEEAKDYLELLSDTESLQLLAQQLCEKYDDDTQTSVELLFGVAEKLYQNEAHEQTLLLLEKLAIPPFNFPKAALAAANLYQQQSLLPSQSSDVSRRRYKHLCVAATHEQAEAFLLLAKCYEEGNGTEKDPIEAEQWFNRYIETQKNEEWPGDPTINEFLAIAKNSLALIWEERARTLVNLFPTKKEEYKELFLKAICYYREAADVDIKAAIKNIAYLYATGVDSLDFQADIITAIDYYRKAVLSPTVDIIDMFNYARCCEENNQTTQAIEYYEKITHEINLGNPSETNIEQIGRHAYYTLGLYYLSEQKSHEKAIPLLITAAEKFHSPLAHYELGKYFLEQQKFQTALEHLIKAQGEKDATTLLYQLIEKLTPAELTAAPKEKGALTKITLRSQQFELQFDKTASHAPPPYQTISPNRDSVSFIREAQTASPETPISFIQSSQRSAPFNSSLSPFEIANLSSSRLDDSTSSNPERSKLHSSSLFKSLMHSSFKSDHTILTTRISRRNVKDLLLITDSILESFHKIFEAMRNDISNCFEQKNITPDMFKSQRAYYKTWSDFYFDSYLKNQSILEQASSADLESLHQIARTAFTTLPQVCREIKLTWDSMRPQSKIINDPHLKPHLIQIVKTQTKSFDLQDKFIKFQTLYQDATYNEIMHEPIDLSKIHLHITAYCELLTAYSRVTGFVNLGNVDERELGKLINRLLFDYHPDKPGNRLKTLFVYAALDSFEKLPTIENCVERILALTQQASTQKIFKLDSQSPPPQLLSKQHALMWSTKKTSALGTESTKIIAPSMEQQHDRRARKNQVPFLLLIDSMLDSFHNIFEVMRNDISNCFEQKNITPDMFKSQRAYYKKWSDFYFDSYLKNQSILEQASSADLESLHQIARTAFTTLPQVCREIKLTWDSMRSQSKIINDPHLKPYLIQIVKTQTTLFDLQDKFIEFQTLYQDATYNEIMHEPIDLSKIHLHITAYCELLTAYSRVTGFVNLGNVDERELEKLINRLLFDYHPDKPGNRLKTLFVYAALDSFEKLPTIENCAERILALTQYYSKLTQHFQPNQKTTPHTPH